MWVVGTTRAMCSSEFLLNSSSLLFARLHFWECIFRFDEIDSTRISNGEKFQKLFLATFSFLQSSIGEILK